MKHLNFVTEIKSVGESGEFEGYAAVFGNVDLGGDILEIGAIKEIETLRNGRTVVLNQHDQRDPIGLADVTVDEKGVFVKGEINLEVGSGRETHILMKSGVIDGMSFGYDVLSGGARVDKTGRRHLNAVKLWEVSPVTFGMNPLARVEAVKSLLAEGQLPSLPEFEKFLREAGFSKTQAVAIANGGLTKLLRSESGDPQAKSAASIALATFRIHKE